MFSLISCCWWVTSPANFSKGVATKKVRELLG